MTSVGTADYFRRATEQLAALRAKTERLQEQIGSGERLKASSEDPVAAARLRQIARAERLAQVDEASAADASLSLRAADDALSDIITQVARARELAVQASSDTISAKNRALIGSELAALAESLLSSANASDAQGRPLFAGDAAGPAYALDTTGAPVYSGSPAAPVADLGDGVQIPRGVTGPEAFDFTANGNPENILAYVKSLATALQSGTATSAAARASLDGFGEALDSLSRAQTQIGVRVAWVELVQDRQVATSEARAEDKAATGGVDFASSVAELQQLLVVLEASQAGFARVSGLTLFDYIR